MSYSRMEARDATPSRRLPGSWLVRAVGVVVWAIINAAILFAEQLAELLAPLLLLAGFAWWAVPRVLGSVKLDGPAGDMLEQVRSHVPMELFLDGDYYTPHGLIYDGLWCIAVVAICRTLSNLLTNLLLERP